MLIFVWFYIQQKKQQEIDEKRYGSRLGPQSYNLDLGSKAVVENRKHIDYDKLSHEIETILNDDNSRTVERSLQKLIENRDFPAASDVVNPNIDIDAPQVATKLA